MHVERFEGVDGSIVGEGETDQCYIVQVCVCYNCLGHFTQHREQEERKDWTHGRGTLEVGLEGVYVDR